MTDKIQIFNYKENKIRTVEMNSKPWFVLKDVCAVLGISNPRMTAQRLDADEVNLADVIDSVGRHQETTVISESGLYNVILRSDKPEAKPFRKWVTNEVLPSIRKNGGYIIGQEELKGEDKEKLEEQIRQLAKQVNAYKEDGNLWMKMYFDIQIDYVNAVEKIYGKKKADIDAPENSSEKEYVVTPEGWILPKSLMDRDDN